jgi:putative phage-type endonuclease
MSEITLIQGSAEWHAHRANHYNASEAGAVMGVSPWLPKNPSQLWDLKNGLVEVKFNSNMQHGIDNEHNGRMYAESRLHDDFTPAVHTVGRYSASLDGLNFSNDFGIEIKCPASVDSKLFDLVTPETVQAKAPHYWWQIVHQFYCVPTMKRLAFVIWHAERQNLVIINKADVEPFFQPLTTAWEAFGAALASKQRPEEDEVDDSEEFQNLVQAYKVEKLRLEAAEKALKAVEEELKGYAQRTGKKALKGFGATVTQVTRQGSIDYTKVPALKGLDLESYRKKPSTYWMVKV